MSIVEDQIIGKGFIVSLFALAVFAYAVYAVIKADPTNSKEVFMTLKEPFSMILAFYLGNRGVSTSK